MKRLTPIKAIRAKCLECCCGSYTEVKECEIKSCTLHPYRLGKRPTDDYFIEDEEENQNQQASL